MIADIDVTNPLGGGVGSRWHGPGLYRPLAVTSSSPESEKRYLQADQPVGVPPLELTGERTLPDVPEENYWFRRHLAVYEWIAAQVEGLRVADLACGEGYGSDVLARGPPTSSGSTPIRRRTSMPRPRYRRPNLRFERDLVENVRGPLDAVVFLQTIEHIEDVPALLAAIGEAAPLAFISTPNRLTLAPEGAEKSDNPWHLREYTIEEYRALLEPAFTEVEIHGLFHTGKLAIHERAIDLGWDRVHSLSADHEAVLRPVHAGDQRLGLRSEGGSDAELGKALDFVAVCRGDRRPRAGSAAMSDELIPEGVGDIAIVLHSHMPYVEGFGTYPFGEEWLFDAVVRSHLPVLEHARDVTVTVTPVLADQLEDVGVRERLLEFVREYRIGSAELDARDVEPALVAACEAEAERYRDALAYLERLDGNPLDGLLGSVRIGADRAGHIGRDPCRPAAPRHPSREAPADRCALRSHTRRFGTRRGFWLPECAYEPGLEHLLAEFGIEYFCIDQSAHEPAAAALRPIATDGPIAFPIDWEAIQWLWSWTGYPSDSRYVDFHAKSLRGCRPWSIAGDPYDPEAAAERAREQGRQFAGDVAARLARHREESGRRGLLTFAIDTELLGHWWWEGPNWLQAVLAELPAVGVRPVTLGRALAEHEPEQGRELRASTWGEGKDRRTWDSPAVADLAWGVASPGAAGAAGDLRRSPPRAGSGARRA